MAAVGGLEDFRYEVIWDVDPRDWAGGSAQSIADHVVGDAHNGAIVVMHMSGLHTAEAIPLMASRLRAKGYELVSVSEMLKGDRLFLDVDGGAEQGADIAKMVDQGFMSGYDRNYFGPNDTITRAQVAKVATLVGGIHTPDVEGADSPAFADVPVRHDSNGKVIAYPFDFVQEAAAAGLVSGRTGPLQSQRHDHPGPTGADPRSDAAATQGISERRDARATERAAWGGRAAGHCTGCCPGGHPWRNSNVRRRAGLRRGGRRPRGEPGSDVGYVGDCFRRFHGRQARTGRDGYEPLP